MVIFTAPFSRFAITLSLQEIYWNWFFCLRFCLNIICLWNVFVEGDVEDVTAMTPLMLLVFYICYLYFAVILQVIHILRGKFRTKIFHCIYVKNIQRYFLPVSRMPNCFSTHCFQPDVYACVACFFVSHFYLISNASFYKTKLIIRQFRVIAIKNRRKKCPLN